MIIQNKIGLEIQSLKRKLVSPIPEKMVESHLGWFGMYEEDL